MGNWSEIGIAVYTTHLLNCLVNSLRGESDDDCGDDGLLGLLATMAPAPALVGVLSFFSILRRSQIAVIHTSN